MIPVLAKPLHISGPNGLWATYNTRHKNLTASEEGYLLTIAPSEIGRLDDFTPDQENAFWNFNFSKATEGLNNAHVRGLTDEPVPDTEEISPVMCALNDGKAAWQAVGTTHGHIIWFDKDSAPGDIQERLTLDRSAVTGGAYHSLGSLSVNLGDADFSDKIRQARKQLRSEFASVAGAADTGFSHYTKQAYAHDPRQNGEMVVEMWSMDHHSLASITGFVRHWNGLTQTPVSPQPIGIQYEVFKPA